MVFRVRYFVLNCRHRMRDDGESGVENVVRCPKCKGLSVIDSYTYVYPKDKRKHPPF